MVATIALSKYFSGLDGLLTDTLHPQVIESSSAEEEWIPTTCWIGKQDCGVLARKVNGRIVKLEGHPDHPLNLGKLCPKGVAQIMQLYDPYRVKAPLKRTNPKGEPGEWVEISWDEALNIVGDKLRDVRERDRRLFIWQKGRSKSSAFYDNAFNKAFGTVNKQTHGAVCSDAFYRATELTFSISGSPTADFRYCKYLIAWGFNFTEAGGPHLCFITWPREIVNAKERGMKIVSIDPRIRAGSHLVDEWLPIKPGTDMALALAMANVLIEENLIDEEYLKNYTNAPFLVKEDGYFLRVDDKEQVWDLNSSSAQPHDKAGIDPALTGGYTVGEFSVKPVFQKLIEHISNYTPEWASDICGIPSETIRRIAREFGENAMIGSKVTIDGIDLPYRPVAIMGYHVSQQELGTQASRAIWLLSMLVGAIDVVGSTRFWERKVDYASYQGKWSTMSLKDVPDKLSLDGSKFYPIASGGATQAPLTLLNPEKYGLPYNPEDMVMMLHMVNPVLTFPKQEKVIEGYKKLNFIVAIDPWLSETADYLADIVLPATTMEKYEGPLDVRTLYYKADTLRLPIIEPMFQSKMDAEIYIELSEKIGILYGTNGFIDHLNKELKLPEDLKLPLDVKPTLADIFDRWAKSKGVDLEWFKKNGVKVSKITTKDLYMRAWSPPYGGVKAHLYSEILKRFGDAMAAKGVPEIYRQDYTPFPTWRSPTMESSPSDYDLYLICFKNIEHKQSRTAFNALLNEIQPENRLLINSETARNRGINDGDRVWVESYNVVTGETARVSATAMLIEGIRPDTVAISHHFGHWVHPVSKNKGVNSNRLFFSGEGYTDMTGNQSFNIKVKVYK